jgi:hypothetical protein
MTVKDFCVYNTKSNKTYRFADIKESYGELIAQNMILVLPLREFLEGGAIEPFIEEAEGKSEKPRFAITQDNYLVAYNQGGAN